MPTLKDRIVQLEAENAELRQQIQKQTEKQERKTGVKAVVDVSKPVENPRQYGTAHAKAFFELSLDAHPELKSNAGVLNALGYRSMHEMPWLSVQDALDALDAKLKQ